MARTPSCFTCSCTLWSVASAGDPIERGRRQAGDGKVASDRTRVMHCLLEAIDATFLRVTDIVTEVTAEGPRTRLGEYRKLRLARARLTDWARAAGLGIIDERVEHGMTSLVFRRP